MPDNLTQDEARARASVVTVSSYQVELDLTGGDTTFPSVTVVRFQAASGGSETFINLTAPKVLEITLNGSPVPLDAFDGDRITLTSLNQDNELRVVAECAYSRSGEGLHRFTDPADGGVYLYSDLETFDAHRIYACFDQPDLKASYELTVTAPADWRVISNMAPDAAENTGPSPWGSAGTSAKRWHFPPTPVMSTYITAVAAGPYHVVRDNYEDIPLGIYCRQSLAQYLDADELFEVTKQGFGFYHQAFGVHYPFGKYDQLFVPEFKEGAMENAGCVTFLEDYIFRSRVTGFAREARAETILHEMAHQWFGDLVTMRWWDDLWLNESFATWAGTLAEAEATKWSSAWTTFAQLYKAWAYRQDQLPSTHPIAADIPDIDAVEVNFDGITYAKGASVLKQLVAYVGRDNFLAGVRQYFADNEWGNATLADLLLALEDTSGRDLTGWSREWLQTAGVNTLRPEYELDDQGRFTAFAVRQEAVAEYPVLRSHRIAIGLYDRESGGLVRRHRVETDISGERTEIAELAGERRPDLVLLNDDDLTYAKIRLDDHSLGTLVQSISEFRDPLPAALAWSAAWDMCRDAEMAARDYVRLVMLGVGSVTDISVTQTLLRQASQAVRRFADPAWRDEGLEYMGDTLHDLLMAAEPGSDAQLAYTQALTGVARTDRHLNVVAGLLDGTLALEGLSIDTDLRWTLLHRLVSQGRAGLEEIDAELARDATDAGQRRAAAARAALPDPANKQRTWDEIVAGRLPNAMFRATLTGFVDPDQEELTAPYRDPFFDVLLDIWANWSSDMAKRFVAIGYTVCPTEQETIRVTDRYISRNSPPAALRRLLVEGRDDVARALRCRERDALAE
ncbi:MAG TPA: aminopeptidase N [Streptosporangiaceae bacterium]